MKKIKTNKAHPHHVPIGVTVLIGIVFVSTLALLFVWNQVPRTTPPAPSYAEKIPEVKPPLPSSPSLGEVTTPVTAPSGPVRPRPAGMVCDDLNYICVDPSFAKTTLTSPFEVNGTSIAVKKGYMWGLEDGHKDVLAYGYLSPSGTLGEFKIRSFIFDTYEASTGTLVLFDPDFDASHSLRIPVKIPKATMLVKLYTATVKDKTFEGYQCSDQPLEMKESIEKIVPTKYPIEATARLAAGETLVSFSYDKGTVTIQLRFQEASDQCYVHLFKAGMEHALMQFSSVRKVIFVDEKNF